MPLAAADADAVNAVALAAFAHKGVYNDWDVLTRGVGAMASLADHAELIVAKDEERVDRSSGPRRPATTPRADFFDPDWAIVRMLVVDPDSHSKGVGRKLTDE